MIAASQVLSGSKQAPNLAPRQQAPPPTVDMAYLVSQYPAVSHTFILREVLSLRQRGFNLRVASVNRPDRPAQKMTLAERQETQDAFYIKSAGMKNLLVSHLTTALRHPVAYVKTLFTALHMGGTDLKRCLWCFFYFVEAVVLGHWMRRQGLKHVHVHFATPAATVGLLAARLFGLRFSLTVHGPDEFYDVPGYHLSEKIAAADFICCIGHYARSQLMKLSDPEDWDKFEIVPLGVDLDAFAARPPLPTSTRPQLLCVGRLVAAKGQHILLAAIDILRRQGRAPYLRLVGDGPDRDSLSREIKRRNLEEHVELAGAVNQDVIRDLYAQADVFVLPSFAEGIPVVLMEAMAMEIPCVTTHITGIPELIRNDIDGLLVAPGDIDALATAIAGILADPDKGFALGRNGRQRIMQHYNLEHNSSLLADVFRRRSIP